MVNDTARDDFASAAMMRLVIAGLRRQGFAPEARSPTTAHVALGDKRDLLQAMLETHGSKVILAISDALPEMPAEPIMRALTCATTIPELLERWHRLETFSHSRHTVSLTPLTDGQYELIHQASDGRAAPSHAESLLVLGTITVLAEMIGTRNVQLVDQADVVLRKDGAWQGSEAKLVCPVVLSGQDAVARNDSNERPSHRHPVASLRQTILADPLNRWTVDSLAAQSGLSKRTLQRRLKEQDTSFSRLVADSRLEVAAEYLCRADGPSLAEIGFLAGYTDQAHFARSFSTSVGTTPRAYRADFQRRE